MGTSNDFDGLEPQDDLSGRRRIDDLLDPTMSDDDLLLAARLDAPQDRRSAQDQRVPPPPSAHQRPGWPPPPTVTHSDRLERDPNGMLGGVISGLSYRFGIDPSLARLLALFSVPATSGAVIPLYLILWGVLPEAAPNSALALRQRPRRSRPRFSRFFGLMMAFVGAIWLLKLVASWAAFMVPIGFIALGVWLFWRDRNAVEDEEVPMPFTDSMDPLATSAEYQRYIVNKAKRLEQQKRRRNTTIGVTALMSTALVIGAIGAFSTSGQDEADTLGSETLADSPRFVDIPDQDPEMNPENVATEESTVEDSNQAVSLTRTSSLARDYTVQYGDLTIDLSNATFDEARTVTISSSYSDVTITVPPGAPVEYETSLTYGNFNDDRFGTEALLTGPSEPLKVVITGEYVDVTLKDY